MFTLTIKVEVIHKLQTIVQRIKKRDKLKIKQKITKMPIVTVTDNQKIKILET